MKTTMKAVMLLACVLFLGAMVGMQHATFAERATRGEVQARRPRPRAIGAAGALAGTVEGARRSAERAARAPLQTL